MPLWENNTQPANLKNFVLVQLKEEIIARQWMSWQLVSRSVACKNIVVLSKLCSNKFSLFDEDKCSKLYTISQISARNCGNLRLATSLRSKHCLELLFPRSLRSAKIDNSLARATMGSFRRLT
jgi:hypothetical protein